MLGAVLALASVPASAKAEDAYSIAGQHAQRGSFSGRAVLGETTIRGHVELAGETVSLQGDLRRIGQRWLIAKVPRDVPVSLGITDRLEGPGLPDPVSDTRPLFLHLEKHSDGRISSTWSLGGRTVARGTWTKDAPEAEREPVDRETLLKLAADNRLADVRDALEAGTLEVSREGDPGARRLRLSYPDPLFLGPDGPRNTPDVVVKLGLDADGSVSSLERERHVPVWAYESDPSSPGGVQPLSPSHFVTDENGRITGLSGPRVTVSMPEEIATELDEINLKRVLESVSSPFPAEVTPRADGAFVFDPHSPLTGATTAFYASANLIDCADRWAGHRVEWGPDGQLEVRPYAFVTDFFNAYFDAKDGGISLGVLGRVQSLSARVAGFTGTPRGATREVEDMLLDSALSRDIVAHEGGHAVLNALKPGMKFGMAMAYNESFADIMSYLSAFDDPDVVARVLEETGGDVRKLNEAARFSELVGLFKKRYYNEDPADDDHAFVRSTLDDVMLSAAGAARNDTDLPGMGFVPSRDPHVVGQVLTRASYHLFASVYEGAVREGASPEDAVARAREVVGTLVTRAPRYMPEHQISFRDAAMALVRVEGDVFGGRYREPLARALEDRELVDPGEDLDAALRARRAPRPDFVLSPDVTGGEAILEQLKSYEALALEAALANPGGEETKALLWHNQYVPRYVRVAPEELELHSDTRSDDGVRVIRFRYADSTPDGKDMFAYVSVVLDETGRIVDSFSDPLIFPEW